MDKTVDDELETVDEVISLLGRQFMAEKIGVAETSISNARKRGVFPSSWFLIIRELLSAEGKKCSEALFSFVEQPIEAQSI
ncbi:MAG: hypothetical protein AAF636_27625 [Pseudomonadota bacterium]